MKQSERNALRDRQGRIDAAVSRRGQDNARAYLARKDPPTRGNIRAGIAFLIAMAATTIILLAL